MSKDALAFGSAWSFGSALALGSALGLLRGELYRLLRKKSMFIYFGALAAGYFVVAFIRSGGFHEGSAVSDALTMFSMLPALAGGFLFASIYTDDLNSKNLIYLVGGGANRAMIVVAKLALAAVFGAAVFVLVPLYHCAVYAALGQAVSAGMAALIFAGSAKYLLAYLAFSALSGIVAYGSQRATFAIVTYLLLAFGVVGTLVSLALNTFAPGLASHLVSGVTDRILVGIVGGGPLALPIAEYAVYVLAAVILSAVVFHRKEMEF